MFQKCENKQYKISLISIEKQSFLNRITRLALVFIWMSVCPGTRILWPILTKIHTFSWMAFSQILQASFPNVACTHCTCRLLETHLGLQSGGPNRIGHKFKHLLVLYVLFILDKYTFKHSKPHPEYLDMQAILKPSFGDVLATQSVPNKHPIWICMTKPAHAVKLRSNQSSGWKTKASNIKFSTAFISGTACKAGKGTATT